jgi:simple sugar transport system substrate-binding protein
MVLCFNNIKWRNKMKIKQFFRLGFIIFFGLSSQLFAADLKVGFVYVNPVGENTGWDYQHDLGRRAVEEKYGDKVETTYVEAVPEGADAERVMTQMALSGHDLIFATSFGFMDPVMNVAAKFPKVKFEHATGYKRADNVATYSARFYEGRTVIGHIAGKMTKTNTIGYIASYPIPEVIRGINAAYLAAKAVNPDIKFKIVWVFTWFDPAKEADAASTLIDQGADMIMQHTDSTAAMTIAEERGVYAFGQASDMAKFGPNAQLTSIIDDWAPYYVKRVGQALNGTWKSEDTWDGLAPGMAAISDFSNKIPSDIRKEAENLKKSIASGKVHSFTGPINKQDGSKWLGDGESSDDGTLLGMNFYVEGIEGEIPQ